MVIDNSLALLGGFNIHRENSFRLYGENRWWDTRVVIRGSLARVAGQLFDAFWRGNRRWLPDAGLSDSALVHNHTPTCRHRLRCIYLSTPCFVPDHHIKQGLKAAARRGVDVRLLVPSRSDVRIARWAARYAYAGLLAAGIRIYEYLPRMLNAKTVVVDGERAMLGTSNLDYRSLFVNFELSLLSRNAGVSTELEQQFLRDLSEAERILPVSWGNGTGLFVFSRPWAGPCVAGFSPRRMMSSSTPAR